MNDGLEDHVPSCPPVGGPVHGPCGSVFSPTEGEGAVRAAWPPPLPRLRRKLQKR